MDYAIGISTVNQRAYDLLCELIAAGHLQIGERLDERDLAEKMNISRTPVREAIGRLSAEGIIERRPYQGNYVRTFSSKQIRDLFDVRKNLETLAVSLAVRNASDNDRAALKSLVERCHAAFDSADRSEFEKADGQFHAMIATLSGNDTLISCLSNLRLQVQLARHSANESLELQVRTIGERNAIVEAFFAKDSAMAAKFMRKHIDGSRDAVLSQLQSRAVGK